MKKLLTILLLAIISISVYSQIEKPITKGNLIVGGTGSLTLSLENNISDSGPFVPAKGTSISLNPTLAYFVADNFALGLMGATSLFFDDGYKDQSIGIGPTISYYFNNGIFSRSELLKTYGKGDNSKSDSFQFNIGAGYALFINSRVSIEPIIKYNSSKMNLTIFEQTIGQITTPELTYDYKWSYLSFELGFNIFW